MKKYIVLMRPIHWIKNGLIFSALVFSKRMFEMDSFITILLGVVSFCVVSSSIYIINDMNDIESDRNHEIKKHRPLASGIVSVRQAQYLLGGLLSIALLIELLVNRSFLAGGLILLYFILNLGYSSGLKNIPILDVVILSSGYVIRAIYGSIIIDQPLSSWLYFTVLSFSFYLSFGKRRNELTTLGEMAFKTKKVLSRYTQAFLDKMMYVCLTMSIVFYALWASGTRVIDQHQNSVMIWTVPLIMVIFMKYSSNIEESEYADPVDILKEDKILIGLVLLFITAVMIIIY